METICTDTSEFDFQILAAFCALRRLLGTLQGTAAAEQGWPGRHLLWETPAIPHLEALLSPDYCQPPIQWVLEIWIDATSSAC